ncbi:MOSC domain-containing protein [Caenorhabditis elegans]|uniref:MOSC domain-containing protein n=1 Tax=Caenorhabditis elegans TaxID=6239 RepID=O44517_CAEEL|nr:MOSC domain-containing protein [Caenorhabditis elegans]CCD65259.1 MOSC domain-containing protein [Caenorhabditis elegans]|eukprot:NP_499948.1 Uncharacterized protein CELE_F56A11.5 [Caenorhabditis elegans]
MNTLYEDRKVIFGILGTSFFSWTAFLALKGLVKKYSKPKAEWVPVGRIKSLHLYPIKSCKGKEVFQYRCTPFGPRLGEYLDRHFLVINSDGKFYTARTKPQMVLIETLIKDGIVRVSYPGREDAQFKIEDVKANKDLRSGFLHVDLRTDGYDCGDAVAEFFSNVLEEPGTRVIMYDTGLFTERTCKTEEGWWNNEVPKRIDDTAYADLAPYMITSQASLDDLNSKLDQNVSSINFRPCIVVDDCAAWDEDKWLDLRIGDVEMQCFKPCTRCILTTVNPETGTKDKDMQPLKKLREFRLGPGKLRQEFGESPIFGVNAGLVKTGYIHVGQTVWAKYKPSAF